MIKLKKKEIEHSLVPYLSQGNRRPKPAVGVWRVVRAILYRLKTGCQWRELSVKT